VVYTNPRLVVFGRLFVRTCVCKPLCGVGVYHPSFLGPAAHEGEETFVDSFLKAVGPLCA